ncbi:hypothetical protein L873DRAFT_1818543 [Choiromyces venosus 120613-1]|uniref:Uncharacterized protein n=1 Tax=Choiromyces venosus 120613-1 TaxID=1336337 RepID=A0A3N4J4A3_9PEZI|nr:hypothetical protein L873DRAFT_1818543 [Choiromyces venosus 120613-1]
MYSYFYELWDLLGKQTNIGDQIYSNSESVISTQLLNGSQRYHMKQRAMMAVPMLVPGGDYLSRTQLEDSYNDGNRKADSEVVGRDLSNKDLIDEEKEKEND